MTDAELLAANETFRCDGCGRRTIACCLELWGPWGFCQDCDALLNYGLEVLEARELCYSPSARVSSTIRGKEAEDGPRRSGDAEARD